MAKRRTTKKKVQLKVTTEYKIPGIFYFTQGILIVGGALLCLYSGYGLYKDYLAWPPLAQLCKALNPPPVVPELTSTPEQPAPPMVKSLEDK